MRYFDSLSQDLRCAFRRMRGNRGLTVVAILSLAVGIGATIAIFSLIYALALRPLPVQRPDQLVEVERTGLGNLHSYAEWKIFRERQDISRASSLITTPMSISTSRTRSINRK